MAAPYIRRTYPLHRPRASFGAANPPIINEPDTLNSKFSGLFNGRLNFSVDVLQQHIATSSSEDDMYTSSSESEEDSKCAAVHCAAPEDETMPVDPPLQEEQSHVSELRSMVEKAAQRLQQRMNNLDSIGPYAQSAVHLDVLRLQQENEKLKQQLSAVENANVWMFKSYDNETKRLIAENDSGKHQNQELRIERDWLKLERDELTYNCDLLEKEAVAYKAAWCATEAKIAALRQRNNEYEAERALPLEDKAMPREDAKDTKRKGQWSFVQSIARTPVALTRKITRKISNPTCKAAARMRN